MVATTFFTLHIGLPYELRRQLIYEHKKAKIADAKATIVCMSPNLGLVYLTVRLTEKGNVDALVAWRGVNF